jgi:GntR family transcriptional regulator
MLKTHPVSKLQQAYDRSRVPLYIQVASVMRQRIEGRTWLPGERIPALEQLEKEFQVARVTVRQAVEIMRQEGRLECYQGRGTFVSTRTQEKYWLELAPTWQSLVASLKDNVAKMIAPVATVPPPAIAEAEGRAAEQYVMLRSVQYHAEAPYGIISAYLTRDLYKKNPKEFVRHPVLPVLSKLSGLKVRRAVQSVVLGSADPEAADLLQVPLGAPTAECRCVVTDDKGVVVYVAEIIYRSDCIRLDIDLLAGNGTAQLRAAPTKSTLSMPAPRHKRSRRAGSAAQRRLSRGIA